MATPSNYWNKAPLRSVTGQPLKIYGRKLVGMTSGSCDFYLHFYVTHIDYPLVSVGRLLNQGYQVELSSEEMTLKSPCGSKIPLHRMVPFFYETITSSF